MDMKKATYESLFMFMFSTPKKWKEKSLLNFWARSFTLINVMNRNKMPKEKYIL
jgi:hypothetical protein